MRERDLSIQITAGHQPVIEGSRRNWMIVVNGVPVQKVRGGDHIYKSLDGAAQILIELGLTEFKVEIKNVTRQVDS